MWKIFKKRNIVSNCHAAAMQIGAVLGLVLTGVIGAYTIPLGVSTLINSTTTYGGITGTAADPLLSIVAPIVVAAGLLVVIAKSADIM